MIVKARIPFEEKIASSLKKEGFIFERTKGNNVFVVLEPGITRPDMFYLPEQVRQSDYDIWIKTEEGLPYDGKASVICGVQTGKPLRPYWLQTDRFDGKVFAAHFNVPLSVARVEVDSQSCFTADTYTVRQEESFISLDRTRVGEGDIVNAGKYLPAAKAALMKVRGKEGVCYYLPNALDFFQAFKRG